MAVALSQAVRRLLVVKAQLAVCQLVLGTADHRQPAIRRLLPLCFRLLRSAVRALDQEC